MSARGRRNLNHVQLLDRLQQSFKNSKYVPLCIRWILNHQVDVSPSDSQSLDESAAVSESLPKMETAVSDLLSQLLFVPRQNIDEIVDLSSDILSAIACRRDRPPRPVVFELREAFNVLSSALSEEETIVQIKAMFVAFVICPVITAPWDHDPSVDASFKLDQGIKSTLAFASDATKSISDGSILISDSIKLGSELAAKVTSTRASFGAWIKAISTPKLQVAGGELDTPREVSESERGDNSMDYSMVVHSPHDTTIHDLRNGSGSSSEIWGSEEPNSERSTGALRLTDDDSPLSHRDQKLLELLSLTGESSDSVAEPPTGYRQRTLPRTESDGTQASSMQVEYDSDEKFLLSSSSGVNYRRRSQIRQHNPVLNRVDESPDSFSLTLNTDSTPDRKRTLRMTKHQPSSQDLSEFPSRSGTPDQPPKRVNRSKSKLFDRDLGRGSGSSSIDRKTSMLSTPSGSSADLTDIIISRRVITPVVNGNKRRLVRSQSEEKFDYNTRADDMGFEDSSDNEIQPPKNVVFLSPRTKLGSQGSLLNISPRPSPSAEFTAELIPTEALTLPLWEAPNKKSELGDLISAARYTVILALRSFGCVMCRRTVSHFAAWSKVMQAIHAQVICVGNGDFDTVTKFRSVTGFQGTILCDLKSTGAFMKSLGCMRGWKRALFNLKTIRAMSKAISAGYKPGANHGDKKQLGGVFVVDRKLTVLMKHLETFAGDLVHPMQVLRACNVEMSKVADLIPAEDSADSSDDVSVNFT